MKKVFTLLFVSCGLFAVLNAQTALDPNQFVNAQITEAGVYTVEAGKFYAFDGRLDLTFEVTIEGPDNGWIMEDATPPVLVQTPSAEGGQRQFFEIKEGGSLTLKNVLFSGTHNNGEVVKTFVRNTGGESFAADNCAFVDWQDFALRNSFTGTSFSVNNCIFVNGVRLSYSKWGGFPVRLDVATDEVVFENNTTVNTGRLLANAGPFFNSGVYQLHNTYVNQGVIAEEFRGNEYMIANNIYYNYHFLGYKNENAAEPYDNYATYFTGLSNFTECKDSLDKISLYMGANVIFREQAINDWFVGKDSISPSLLWEFAEVDSFINFDDNFTIGANYNIEPGFTTPPGNTPEIIANIEASYYGDDGTWADWRIESPVSYDEGGLPQLSWPPAFDLTYSHSGLLTAGTDGLPVGDLNWYPDKKAEYLANRDAILESLRDSMVNAQVFYDPETMDDTPMITELGVSIGSVVVPGPSGLTSIYPNPFEQKAQIQFTLSQEATVTLVVYSVTGQKVYEMAENEFVSGTHNIDFDASDLSSGMYVYTINATGVDGQNFVDSRKMIKE